MSTLKADTLENRAGTYSVDVINVIDRTSTACEQIKGVYYPKIACTDHSDIAEVGSLRYLMNVISSDLAIIRLPAGNYIVLDNMTLGDKIPANIILEFDHGAYLTISTGKSVDIVGRIVAPTTEIFKGAGTVTLTLGHIETAWYGSYTSLNATAVLLGTFTLDDNATYEITAKVMGHVDGAGGNRATYIIHGLFYRNGGIAVQQGATTVISSIEADAAWACDFSLLNNDIRISANGKAADGTITWTAEFEIEKLTS